MLKNKLFILSFLLILIFSLNSYSQINLSKYLNHPWVDSVLNSLTPDDRISQLIWIDVNAGDDLQKQFHVSDLIRKNNFGGLIFFAGNAVKQGELINYYQSLSKTPLIVAMDAEWGAGMRLNDVQPFPFNLTMGAVSDDQLIQKCAVAIALQLKRLGVQVSLGPVADINTEPQNPIIGIRSFGESRDQVTRKCNAYMKGLQENGIMVIAKHYPCHGNTKSDSPSGLSYHTVEGVIRKEWNYQGLSITDAMNMGGVTGFGEPGKSEVQALKAGNDVIEFPVDGELALQAIREAIRKKELTQDEINLKCRRVLAAKYLAGLSHRQPLKVTGLLADLNSSADQFIQQQVMESALTLLENKNQLIPLQGLDTLRVAALSVGSPATTPFQRMLGNYTKVDYFNLSEDFTEAEANEIIKKLGSYNLVITGVHSLWECKNRRAFIGNNTGANNPAHPYGVTENLGNLLSGMSNIKNSILVFFANPYAINEIKEFGHPNGLLIAYQNTTIAQELAAQLIFGGIGAGGRLPVSLGTRYASGEGITISQPIRLKYTLPEEVGLSSAKLNNSVDSIVNNALVKKAFPGCNVLIAKDGKVIFQKAYGFHTYEDRVPSKLDDIYDLASVTKVSGALPAFMKLYEGGRYQLDKPFSTYWPDWRKGFLHPSNKSDLTARELLTHQAGLIPDVLFWKETVNDKGLINKWYRSEQSEQYNLEVARGMYLNCRFKTHVYKAIRKSPLNTRGKYVYSDLFFVMAPGVIERLSGIKYIDYLDHNFYRPLGATTVTYLPSQKFSDDQIVPAEYDNYYRKRLIHSTVHDESSAVLGGISGNAGLFASANDLAKIVQMYVQFGTYGGRQYLKRSTLEEFSRIQFPQNNNRRGLGFDKPLINNQKFDREHSYPCPSVSPQSFGHSGFTGTFFWADPSNGLIYIFLSNRVYPTRENNKISELNVRTDILQLVYEQLNKSKL